MSIAHQRKRSVIDIFLKRLKFSPVVSIQGPRQCGKSYFVRELLPKKLSQMKYLTLDKKELRTFAEANPHSFLIEAEERPLIIDEAQKAPSLFDEIKSLVDERRAPGQFVLLGSTEFSIETKVKESLTGRLSRIRLYPFNLSESLKNEGHSPKSFPFPREKPIATRQNLLRYLARGGFPGIFNVHDNEERSRLLEDWISLTAERDIFQFGDPKLNSEGAKSILKAIAELGEPNIANISEETKIPNRTVQRYVKVLKSLFTIIEILPLSLSTGKPIYFLTDTGLLDYYSASFEKKLLTWVYLEAYSQLAYTGYSNRPLYFYRTSKGKFIDIVYEYEPKKLIALKVIPKEGFDKRDFLIFDSLTKKFQEKFEIKKVALTGTSTKLTYEGCAIHPWESLA
jgi:predicted AAA+ superfamily ATPase